MRDLAVGDVCTKLDTFGTGMKTKIVLTGFLSVQNPTLWAAPVLKLEHVVIFCATTYKVFLASTESTKNSAILCRSWIFHS